MNLLGILSSPIANLTTTGDTGGGFWLPPPASTLAESVDWVFFFIYWVSVFFFVLIMALMVIFVVKYRRREGVKAQRTATHNTPLELTWTIIPLILVVVMFYMGLKSYVNIVEAPKNAYEVNVIGRQWSWEFQHRNGATDTNLLTVPAGRPVKLIMTSKDVLHSVFVPAFRVKQDVIPGRYTYLWFEAPDPGTYQLFCSEYCGTEHSQMTAIVEVLPPAVFEDELERRANILQELTRDEYPAHVLDRIYARCQSCHNLDESVKQGPGFWQTFRLWGKNRVLADGREVVVDENYIRKSIINPQADVVADMPGKMVTFQGQLSDLEIDAIIEFFKRMDEVIDENGNRIGQE